MSRPKLSEHIIDNLPPRILRPKEAHHYLRMNEHTFNAIVRPYIVTIPFGPRAIAFDRVDLDRWVDETKRVQQQSSGVRNTSASLQKETTCQSEKIVPKASTSVEKSGKSTNESQGMAVWSKVAKQVLSSKPKRT